MLTSVSYQPGLAENIAPNVDPGSHPPCPLLTAADWSHINNTLPASKSEKYHLAPSSQGRILEQSLLGSRLCAIFPANPG